MKSERELKVEVIMNPPEGTFDSGANGGLRGTPYEGLEEHPDVLPHRPRSRCGAPYVARLDDSGLFTWVYPVPGGVYSYSTPVFRVTVVEGSQ